jgi:hypothetical protein
MHEPCERTQNGFRDADACRRNGGGSREKIRNGSVNGRAHSYTERNRQRIAARGALQDVEDSECPKLKTFGVADALLFPYLTHWSTAGSSEEFVGVRRDKPAWS